MKLLSRLSTLALSFALAVSTAGAMEPDQTEQITQLSNVSPTNTEVALDLHDTLLAKNIKAMATVFLASLFSRKSSLATASFIGGLFFDYARYGITRTVGIRQNLVIGIRALLKKGTVGEEYFKLIGNYNPALRAVAEDMATQFTIIPGMEALLQELTELGYTLRLASNIGGGSELENMKKKFPQLFQYLTGGKAVEYENVVELIKKPNIEYFNQYQAEFNPNGTKTIIFIDDDPVSKSHPERPLNTAVAKQAGMIGITFKNAKQLRADLIKLGIKLKETESALRS